MNFINAHKHHILGFLSLFLFLLGFCMLANSFFSYTSSTQQLKDPIGTSDKRVLLLFSYSSTYISEEYVRDGVQQVLYENGIEYDCLYMDTKELGDEVSQALFTQQLENKLTKIQNKYDGVITCDDDALEYVLNHQSEYFEGLPVTFLGVNDVDRANRANSYANISGFIEYNYTGKLLEVIQKLMPNARRVVGIVDSTSTGQGSEKQFYTYQPDFPYLDFEVLNASLFSREELGAKLSQYGDDTILIYLDVIEDKNHNYYTISENASFFSTSANIPVFKSGMGGIGDGIVGNVFSDFETMASNAAKELILMMNGNLKSQNLDSSDEYTFQFDVDALKEHKLNKSYLPKEVEYINDPTSYMDEYGNIILPVFICLLAIVLELISTQMLNQEIKHRGQQLNEKEDQILYASQHDSLTGLYNQHYLTNRLHDYIDENTKYSILVADIDDLGYINDNYSRLIGDEVILEISKRLKEFANEHRGFISHYGGDEFILIFNNATLNKNDPLLNRILTTVQKPIEVEGLTLFTSVCIGVKNVDINSNKSAEEHILDADVAMYEAKKFGKNQITIYAKDIRDRVVNERNIVKELEYALDHDGFYMMYQPQIETQTKKIYGLEALVRLESGKYAPSEFISIAEKKGLICRLGRVTIEKVIQQMYDWKQAGMELKPVSINYSAGQIKDTEFVTYLKSLLEKYNIPSHFIEIEITEDLFMDNTRESMQLIDDFNEIGVKLLMDDFGTGYSTLSYLSYIPFDTIKIDKTLVDSWANEKSKDTMDDLIQMAHHLNHSLIAEGVETEEQYKILKQLNCDKIQGYYFYKPLKQEDVIQLSTHRKVWS